MENVEIEVKRDKKAARKRRWITVGIIMLLIGIVIELWLGNYESLVTIIPILYLNNLRKTL